MQPSAATSSNSQEPEVDFDSALEEDITEEDKIYIFAVVTRLRRILNWDPGEDEILFDKSRGDQIIRQGLMQFQRWKEFVYDSASPETPRIQHLIIYSLAKLCFFYWIRDSDLVAEVLREVYDSDNHFSSMFAHIVSRYDRRSLWRHGNEYSRNREDAATLYFVHHAYNTKLCFDGHRFVDMRLRHPLSVPPVFLAAIYSRPNLLLKLLRYGARLNLQPDGMNDNWTLPMLLRHLIRILWNSIGDGLQQMELDSLETSSIVVTNTMHTISECISILLRAVPQIRMGEMNFLLMKFDHGVLSGSVCSHYFIRMMTGMGLVPKLVNRYLEPSDLQHLSRCVIRSSLNEAWNLPYGVDALPLPKLLKAYISLSRD